MMTSSEASVAAIPSSSSSPSAAAAATASLALITCSNCGLEEHRLLHQIRHRGTFRRLCSTCVLRFHPQSFCPSCFTVYGSASSPPPTPNPAVTCAKCYSSSHIDCVGPNPSNPYVCPLCISPNSAIFSPRKVNDLAGEYTDAHAIAIVISGCGEYRVIDRDNARILLAAAKISAVSMTKAAVAARAEAERRAKEAANTRKRARVALEHVAYLVAKDKMKKKERFVFGGSGRGGGGGYSGRNNTPAPHLLRADGSRNGNTSTPLSAVSLREGEKLHLNGSAVPMEVEAPKNSNASSDGDVVVVAQKKNNVSGK